MKRVLWPVAALLVAGLMCGCGSQQDGSTEAVSRAGEAGENAAATDRGTPSGGDGAVSSFKSSTPKETVSEFLSALQSGDKETTEALLTTKARQETEAHGLVVGPPGAPGATYSIGQVEPIEGDKSSAYVSCVWSEKENDAEFEVVWILRQEQAGWRVAGMATRLGDSNEPVVLNFEDLSELERQMRQAEMAQQQKVPRQTQGSEGSPAAKNTTAANNPSPNNPAVR